MNNKRGQALIEFVLVLPILIFILLAFVDIARLMIMKNHLESVLATINDEREEIKDDEYKIEITKTEKDNKIKIELKSCLDTTTPGLNKIVGDPACVSVSKYIDKKEEEG